jgi:conjugative transfer signal peptidase TraF
MTPLGYIAAVTTGVLLMASTIAVHLPPLLLWNASASTPIGLYLVLPPGMLRRGDLVVVSPPPALAAFMDARRYLPLGVPLLKQVLATVGQVVCRSRDLVTVDGTTTGLALDHDHLGRPMPTWRGCRQLGQGDVFLMNRNVSDSVDGRYFGPLATSTVIGRAIPLWTDPHNTGAFRWLRQTS